MIRLFVFLIPIVFVNVMAVIFVCIGMFIEYTTVVPTFSDWGKGGRFVYSAFIFMAAFIGLFFAFSPTDGGGQDE